MGQDFYTVFTKQHIEILEEYNGIVIRSMNEITEAWKEDFVHLKKCHYSRNGCQTISLLKFGKFGAYFSLGKGPKFGP